MRSIYRLICGSLLGGSTWYGAATAFIHGNIDLGICFVIAFITAFTLYFLGIIGD